MELLYVDVMQFPNRVSAVALNSLTWQFSIGTPPTGFLAFSDPRVFAMRQMVITKGVQSAYAHVVSPNRYQFQTLDGHGYLLASDAFNVGLDSEGTNTINSIAWRLYYRFVDIPLTEFIGLVQSMQAQ